MTFPVTDAAGSTQQLLTAAELQAAFVLSASADDIFAITPSDTVPLSVVPKALYVTVSGNLSVRGTGSTPTIIPVTAGQVLPIRPRYVYASNTTATVVGLV